MHRKIIKVFLGSPGDLADERRAAKVIVDEENANHANDLGYHIELVGWEDTVSQRRRAQDAINIDLDQCEYFVGMIWKKWGTPPGPEGHPYSSGFEEEYRRSVARHERTGKPEISLLFKEIPKDDLQDVGKQLEKVLIFQDEVNNEKKQFYQKFQDVRDFERVFRSIISKFLKDQKNEDLIFEVSEPKKPRDKAENATTGVPLERSSKIFKDTSLSFLENFIYSENSDEYCTAARVARFRLLACCVSRAGNDVITLGTHDSNLLYRESRYEEFSEAEYIGLITSAIEAFDSRTVPLFHWLFRPNFNVNYELPLRTFYGDEKRRRNAFNILEVLSISPSDYELNFAVDISMHWFGDEVPSDVMVSALEYLGSVGDGNIVVDWPNLIGSSEANIAGAAVRAFARITARSDINEALRFVAKHEGAELTSELISELLSSSSTIETSVLRQCLNNRTSRFLKVVAKILLDRDSLEKSDIEILAESSDADIRLIGVKSLSKINPSLSLSEVRSFLIRPSKAGRNGFAFGGQDRDFQGEAAFEEYSIEFLRNLPYDELRQQQKFESFYSNTVTLAIYKGYFKKSKKEIENNILDGFNLYCYSQRDSIDSASLRPSDEVYNFVRRNILQDSFEIYCRFGDKGDLDVVRKVLDKFEINFSYEIVNFLAKFGRWDDVFRIIKLSKSLKINLGVSTLLFSNNSEVTDTSAKAILKLGSDRVADVWRLELANSLRVKFIINMQSKLFSAFDNQKIIEMLLHESDAVRESVALKCVICLSKERNNEILNSYLRVDGVYYYNVVFWLDLGLSASRKLSRGAAMKVLSRLGERW